MDTLGKIFHVNFLIYSHWLMSILISQMMDHSIYVDQARYSNYIVAKYLDTATVKESTKFYKTTLPSDMIFTKADTSTSDEQVEKLTKEFNIYYRSFIGLLIYLLSTRVDLSFSVHKLAKFSENPGKLYFEGLVHLFRYMNIWAKVFISLIFKRLFKIIKKDGVKYQFGSSPGVGCQDRTFTIKTILHTRHNHNLPSYAAFVDLIKAFETVNHDMMLKILERYGAPPKLRSAIYRMYQDLKIVLKIGRIEEKTSQTVGVRQGYCMDPVLFLFMVMAFAETLEK